MRPVGGSGFKGMGHTRLISRLLDVQRGDFYSFLREKQSNMFADTIAAARDDCDLLFPIVLGACPVVLHTAAQKIVEESCNTEVQ